MKWDTLKDNVARGVASSIKGNPNYVGLNRVHVGDQMLVAISQILSGEIHDSRKAAGTSNIQWATACALAEAAYQRVKAWDIRCVGTLRDLFPAYFPKALRSGPLVAYIEDTDAGCWLVEKA